MSGLSQGALTTRKAADVRFADVEALHRGGHAVDAHGLDQMITHEPRLGLALLASLARRLSLRLRQVSARLSALLSRG